MDTRTSSRRGDRGQRKQPHTTIILSGLTETTALLRPSLSPTTFRFLATVLSFFFLLSSALSLLDRDTPPRTSPALRPLVTPTAHRHPTCRAHQFAPVTSPSRCKLPRNRHHVFAAGSTTLRRTPALLWTAATRRCLARPAPMAPRTPPPRPRPPSAELPVAAPTTEATSTNALLALACSALATAAGLATSSSGRHSPLPQLRPAPRTTATSPGSTPARSRTARQTAALTAARASPRTDQPSAPRHPHRHRNDPQPHAPGRGRRTHRGGKWPPSPTRLVRRDAARPRYGRGRPPGGPQGNPHDPPQAPDPDCPAHCTCARQRSHPPAGGHTTQRAVSWATRGGRSA